MYLKSPSAGGSSSPSAMRLSNQPPSSSSVYRTTLPDGNGRQAFRWDNASWVRFTGTAGATLYVSGPTTLLGLLGGPLTVDVELRRCAGEVCTTLVTQSVTTPGQLIQLGYSSVSVNFGAIDVVLTNGESLEVVVIAPSATTRDVWLAHDSTAYQSRFVFDRT